MTHPDPPGAAEFDELLSPLGPWPEPGSPSPIAIAVSGGADSTALCVLAADWAATHGLAVLALVVDHGLRPGSAREASITCARLSKLGIPVRLLTLHGLTTGPAMAERARIARYDALTRACRDAGAIDLLLGHHAADQAETVLMRRRAASGPDGLAGMARLVETADLRLIRPLLTVPPARLRDLLRARGLGWIEDPSNYDPRAQRTRLRQELAAPGDERTPGLLAAAADSGRDRTTRQRDDATLLAGTASLRPEGFALLPPALLPPGPMSALIRTVGGSAYRPSRGGLDTLLRRPHACTLAGTRLIPSGRLGPGWLLLREAASIGPDRPAIDGMLWDDRYRLDLPPDLAPLLSGARISALGTARPPTERRSVWPAALLSTLPALWRDDTLLSVPHLLWTIEPALAGVRVRFRPAAPASASMPFTAG